MATKRHAEIPQRSSGAPSDAQPTDNRPTIDAQSTHKQLTTDPQTTDSQQGETPRRQIRISDTDWERLTWAARSRGISTSALIRQVLREWLKGAGK